MNGRIEIIFAEGKINLKVENVTDEAAVYWLEQLKRKILEKKDLPSTDELGFVDRPNYMG